jgi:broad specificity phosphatase PhoE
MKTVAAAVCWCAVLALPCGCGGPGGDRAAAAGKVFVCRHCQYDSVSGRLTEKGREQAAGIAGKLEGQGIDLVLHSSVVRCAETAAIVRERLGTPGIRVAGWLHEDSLTAGEWEDRVGDGNVLLVTHRPVIRQITEEPEATKFGTVTRVR